MCTVGFPALSNLHLETSWNNLDNAFKVGGSQGFGTGLIKQCFSDVAIAAPQEDDLLGAIYIYNGRRSGIAQSFSQVRLSATVLFIFV